MLKRFLAIFALLVAALVAPMASPAHAVTYTENYTGWQSRVCSSNGDYVTYQVRVRYLQYNDTDKTTLLVAGEWSGPALVSDRFLPTSAQWYVRGTWYPWHGITVRTQGSDLAPAAGRAPKGQTPTAFQIKLKTGCIIQGKWTI